MQRNKTIGFAILLVGLCGVLALLRSGGSKHGPQAPQTATISTERTPTAQRRLFTMNQLFAEGQSKAGIGHAGKHDAAKDTPAMSSPGLDDVVAEMLDSDPQLRKFYNLRRKAVRTSAEQQDYLAMISDAKLIADARKDLLEAVSATDIDQAEELRRLQRIQFLNSALAWEDNPERAKALEAVTTVILADLPSGASKSVTGSVLGDKFDLFQLLMLSEPEQAKTLLAKVQGTPAERILLLAWRTGSERTTHQM
jgi:hypothetical protein